jgi:hypothetical protein
MLVYLVFLLSLFELFYQVVSAVNLWWPLEWRTSLQSIIDCGTIWTSQNEKKVVKCFTVLNEKYLLQQSEDYGFLKQENVLPENLTCREKWIRSWLKFWQDFKI